MGRPVIRACLAILLTLAWSHSSKGGAKAAKQIELTKQSDEIQASPIENSLFRATRDARRKSHRRGKGNNQNKRKPYKGRKKSGKAKKDTRKHNKKMEGNRKNRMKLKRKEKKNKKKLRKNKKNISKKGKKSRTKKNRSKKDKKKSRKNKKKSGQKKKSKQTKRKLRKTRRKLGQEKIKKNKVSKWEPKQICDEEALCQKIKDYIKISNQLRKVRRIMKSCDTMDKKAKKSAAEFEATVTALETAIGSSSGRRIYRSRWRRAVESSDDVTSIKDKLKNCSVTAKAKCEKSSVAPCQEEENLSKCETELEGWLTKFGPAKGSCLQASSDCCACITALPDVSKDCLAFDEKSTLAVASKKKCTSGDEQGSFGFCKKLQVEAAEKGPKHAKDNCPSDGNNGITTTRTTDGKFIKCTNPKPPYPNNSPCILPDGRTKNGTCCGIVSQKKMISANGICYPPGTQCVVNATNSECVDIRCTSNKICYNQGCGKCEFGRCTYTETEDICKIKDCTNSSQCAKSCAGCFGRKCLPFESGIENCCPRKLKGNTFHHLVAHNETDNCKSGCMYTADVTKEGQYCLDEETAVCNLTALAGNTSMHQHLTRTGRCGASICKPPFIPDPPGMKCYTPIKNGRYECYTTWYVIEDIDDFTNFKLVCSLGQSLNGFKLVCFFDPINFRYWCRYHFWCSPISTNSILVINTPRTVIHPLSESVLDFTNQDLICNAEISPILGLTMKTDLVISEMYYALLCGTVDSTAGAPSCHEMSTNTITPISAHDYDFIYLPPHVVQCPTETTNNPIRPSLGQFRLQTLNGMLFYEYLCCSF